MSNGQGRQLKADWKKYGREARNGHWKKSTVETIKKKMENVEYMIYGN